MDDAQIITLYNLRDEQAIAETANKYKDYCHIVANRILQCHADAEEIVSETWLQAWNSIPPQSPTHLKLYLAKITRNRSIDRWRKRYATKRSGPIVIALEELKECVGVNSSLEDTLQAEHLRNTINAFLHSLPMQARNVFLRRYFYLEETKEIALRYSLMEANVHQILHRTRKKLKQHLIQEGYVL